MEVEFVGSGLPTPPSQPDLNFDNFNQMHHLAQLKGPSSFSTCGSRFDSDGSATTT